MKLTESHLRSWFSKFNGQYFDGQLAEPKWKVGRRRSKRLGYFRPDNENHLICVSAYYVLDEQFYQTVLLHEMIHLWQRTVAHAADVHGATFKRKAAEIGLLSGGRHAITRCTQLPQAAVPATPSRRPASCCVFVWPDSAGVMLCRCTKANAGMVYHGVLKRRFAGIRLYQCSGEAVSQLAGSRSRVRCYRFSAEEWQTRFAPAVERELRLPDAPSNMFINIFKKIR